MLMRLPPLPLPLQLLLWLRPLPPPPPLLLLLLPLLLLRLPLLLLLLLLLPLPLPLLLLLLLLLRLLRLRLLLLLSLSVAGIRPCGLLPQYRDLSASAGCMVRWEPTTPSGVPPPRAGSGIGPDQRRLASCCCLSTPPLPPLAVSPGNRVRGISLGGLFLVKKGCFLKGVFCEQKRGPKC